MAAVPAAALCSDCGLFLAACSDVIFKSELIFCSRGELANDTRPLFLVGGAFLPFAILEGLRRPQRTRTLCSESVSSRARAVRANPPVLTGADSQPKHGRKTDFVVRGCYKTAECRFLVFGFKLKLILAVC